MVFVRYACVCRHLSTHWSLLFRSSWAGPEITRSFRPKSLSLLAQILTSALCYFITVSKSDCLWVPLTHNELFRSVTQNYSDSVLHPHHLISLFLVFFLHKMLINAYLTKKLFLFRPWRNALIACIVVSTWSSEFPSRPLFLRRTTKEEAASNQSCAFVTSTSVQPSLPRASSAVSASRLIGLLPLSVGDFYQP